MVKFVETEIGMIPEELKETNISKCLKDFLAEEKCILTNELNERTISHKLAEYLQKSFKGYYVDCEYNRMPNGRDPKEYIKKTLELDSESICSNDENGITVYPDIIVHKRGINDNNYFVIEIKKKKYADEKRKNGETY